MSASPRVVDAFRATSILVCPALQSGLHVGHLPGRVAWVSGVSGGGYRAKFRCEVCRTEFAISDAQLRRIR